jgi:hypothetical protein
MTDQALPGDVGTFKHYSFETLSRKLGIPAVDFEYG